MASDTSLVFNLLGRDNISKVLRSIKGAFQSAGRQAEQSMNEADRAVEKLDRSIEELERDLSKLAIEFAATGDKELFKKMKTDRSAINTLKKIRSEIKGVSDDSDRADPRISNLVDALSRTGATASGAAGGLGQLGPVMSVISGPAQMLVVAVLGLIAALYAIGPAVAIAGGALGSLPGILSGGLAAFGTLKLGLSGLSSEYQRLTSATGGGGGGGGGATKATKDFTAANRAVESAIRGVASAEKSVRDAQKEALDAQKAINEARETAAERMRDQALDLEGARIDQRQATDDLSAAELDLANAQRSGNAVEIEKAQLAYERASLAVKTTKVRVDDLSKAVADNTRKGVEGSDEVVQAKAREQQARERVAEAIEQEKEAEERLADARKSLADQKAQGSVGGGGGGGGGGLPVTKLAPAAREFLNTVLRLRPAFDALRLDVQQRLFAGLAVPLQTLAERWLPQLHTTLGAFATTFNGIAKTAFASASKRTFIENMAKGAEGFRVALDRVGQVVAGPLVDAFGRLSAASTPFVEKLGDLMARGAEKAAAWIKKMDESGKLKSFFEGAASTLGKVVTLGGKVFTIVGKVIGIIYGQSKAAGDSVLDMINGALDKVSIWLDNPANQKKIREVVDGLINMGKEIGNVFKTLFTPTGVGPSPFDRIMSSIRTVTTIIKGLNTVMGGTIAAFRWLAVNGPKPWNAVKGAVTSAYHWVVNRGNALVSYVRGLPRRIRSATAGMWDGIKNSFRSAVNSIIGWWNRLSFSIGGGSFMGFTFPGMNISTPNIPYLAKGGTVNRSGVAVVGDRGPEMVSLSRGAQVTPLQPAGRGGNGGGTLVLDLRGADSEMKRLIRKWIRTDNLLQGA
jgi:hypothetical protein